MTCKDTDVCFDIFATKYDQMFNKCFPVTRMSIKRCNYKKWMTEGITNSIRMKTILYQKYINTPNDNNKRVYWQYKNKLTIIMRQAEKLYYRNLLLHGKRFTRELWKIYAKLFNKDKRNITNVNNLIVNDIDLNDNESIAKAMNQYFVTVGKEMSKII